jgi:hypothetical protein
MSRHLRGLLLIGTFFLLMVSTAWTGEEMVANPYYKFWANSKPGAKAVHLEVTKLSGPEGKLLPDGTDEKRIAYKLVKVDEKTVVVEMVVTEQDFLGYVQAAPTRYIYPAKLKKSHLERILLADGGKKGEDTVKVGDKEIKCRTVSGTVKEPGGEQVEFKLWLSDEVPGTIVKQVRTAHQKGGNTIAETTITLKSYKQAE